MATMNLTRGSGSLTSTSKTHRATVLFKATTVRTRGNLAMTSSKISSETSSVTRSAILTRIQTLTQSDKLVDSPDHPPTPLNLLHETNHRPPLLPFAHYLTATGKRVMKPTLAAAFLRSSSGFNTCTQSPLVESGIDKSRAMLRSRQTLSLSCIDRDQ